MNREVDNPVLLEVVRALRVSLGWVLKIKHKSPRASLAVMQQQGETPMKKLTVGTGRLGDSAGISQNPQPYLDQ